VIERLRRRRANGTSDSRNNIRHHYDLGNAFYRLWLDRQLSYTCAYFPSPEITLEEAQIAKMDHVCRKLRLQPGEKVVEAGCGWGALALHMATRYGVHVKAFNISREQIAYAIERARALGTGGRVEFIEDDYRNIRGRFDAFVSVGMLEHVGRENYHALGSLIDRVLEGDGRGLIHSIGHLRPDPLNAWIEKRIFPGAYPPSLREILEVLEPSCFSVLDVENLRLHYALTLEHWLRRFDDARERVREMYDERFVRAWRLYLCGAQAAFRAGEMQLFQVLFARGRSNRVPWTRAYQYDSAGARE
jgi:cyclopropane-fatty-acyl-phospholipid synthase